jgi:hypothetical protein
MDESQTTMTNYNVTRNSTAWTDTSAKTTYQQDTDVILIPPACYDEHGNTISNTTKWVSQSQQSKTQPPTAEELPMNSYSSCTTLSAAQIIFLILSRTLWTPSAS